jgi:hypothetical protein
MVHGSWALFLRYAQAGAAEAAVSHMTPLLGRGASMGDNIAIMIAEGYSLIGRNDDALKWIPDRHEPRFSPLPLPRQR